MTFAGILFFLLGLILAVVAGQKLKPRIVSGIALPALYLFHTGMALAFWNVASNSTADANFYYASSAYPSPIGISNAFVIWILHFFRSFLDGIAQTTFLDYFVLFSFFGYIGLIYFYATISPLLLNQRKKFHLFGTILLLLAVFSPGLNFWTASIGKDSLVFMGLAMAVFSSVDISKRWPHLVIGMVIACMIRPHILIFAMMALALNFLLAGRISIPVKIFGWAALIMAAVLFGPIIADFIGLKNVDVLSLTEYVEQRQSYNLDGGSSVNIEEYSIIGKVLSYLFRPLFFDARNAAMLGASLDNLVLIGFVLLALSNFRFYVANIFKEPAALLNLLFAGIGVCALAMTTANLGIAVRQKTMFIPSLMLVVAWGIQHGRLAKEARRQHATYVRLQRDQTGRAY